jgi:hypothetical protein
MGLKKFNINSLDRKDFVRKRHVTDEKRLPSKREMASNLTKSLVKTAKALVSGDAISAEGEVREKRMKTCKSCSWYIKDKQRCAHCGCIVPVKIFLKEESCPIGKW